MVNSTVGTTVEGSIDPVTEIGEICAKYKIWHHVDAALGGAYLMNPSLISKMGSFQHVDSLTFNPHKALVVPLQCSIFLCKYTGLMQSCNGTKSDYLFHKQRASYDGCLDVGDKVLQCGRVIDIVKLWTYLKGNGWKTIAKQVESEHNLALYVRQYVIDHPDRFELAVPEVDTFNVCFWYKPVKLDVNAYPDKEDYYKKLSAITVLAKKYMIEDGKILIGYSKSKGPHYFWRQVMSNPHNTHEEADFEMERIAEYC